MDINTPKLPKQQLHLLNQVKIRQEQKKRALKKEKPCKYLDQLLKGKFLKEYFKEK